MMSDKKTEAITLISNVDVSQAKLDSNATPAPGKDAGSPEEIRAGIERTREHMDEHLASLGRKLRPLSPKRLKIPLMAAAALGLGLTVFQLIRSKRHPKPPKRELRWRSTNLFDQILLMKSLAMAVKKGKPAVFVVQPDR